MPLIALRFDHLDVDSVIRKYLNGQIMGHRHQWAAPAARSPAGRVS
jgi:hypothetical protein